MGLYGERVGAFSVVTASAEERAKVDSQIKMCVVSLFPFLSRLLRPISASNAEPNRLAKSVC